MIINGGSRCNAQFFAKHLTNGEENERVTLCEIRSMAAQTIGDAFREMGAVAIGTRCRNYFYHANLNPLSTETMSPEQWTRAVDLLEANLGLKDHARFIVEHQKKGRVHRHAIWLRIDVNRMLAVAMTDDYEKHQGTARQLEREFRLQRGRSVLGPERLLGGRPARRPKSWETFRGNKSGIDPYALTQDVTVLYKNSKDAQDFAHNLKEYGCILVKGDRRDFCIVDSAGHVHSLGRRLIGIPAAEVSQFVSTLSGTMVPSLTQLREYRSGTTSATN